MSAITFAELDYGAALSADPERECGNLAAPTYDIPMAAFDYAAGKACGPIRRAARDSQKRPSRLLIAAHAVAPGVPRVTNKRKDFAQALRA